MEQFSLTGKRWIIGDVMNDASIADAILQRRGIDALGEGEILESFGHNPKHFTDFEKSAARIKKAVENREQVAVFGDYDCDGITGAALLIRFLRRHGLTPLFRLPHRINEGYGLRKNHVEDFAKESISLLLTVDTGVTAVDAIALAKEKRMDVIVLDHHTLPPVLPEAFAILHPGLTVTPMLGAPCGAGVAWTAIEGWEAMLGTPEWEEKPMDIALAAIGTVADIVELRGGNRTLVHSGLMALQTLRDGPLKLLCQHAGLEAPCTSRDIGFRIAPRINAAGRMADPHIALHALLGDPHSMLELDALNRERQDVVMGHLEELLPQAENYERGFLCFSSESYSPGICGLLAGRLCENFGKPSLIAADVDGICTASLRSVPGYDITAGLARCHDLLLSFGGHAMAAGCTFPIAALGALQARLEEDMMSVLEAHHLVPTLVAEGELEIENCTLGLCDALRILEPFGQGNPEPRFLVRNVRLDDVRAVGGGGKHLQGRANGRKLIGFGLGHLHKLVTDPVDLLCRIGIDTWQGRKQVQLFVDDVRFAEKAQLTAHSSRQKALSVGNGEL